MVVAVVVLLGWSSMLVKAAQTNYIVVPNEYANKEGDSHMSMPFSTDNHLRYQQVYDASQFIAISPYGGWIISIGFRIGRDRSTPYVNPYGAAMPRLQVNLSTTPKAPDQLSLVYTENVGSDEAIVFGPVPRNMNTFPVAGWPASLTLPLTKPFFYNPRNGNLLMDVFNFDGSGTNGGLLDATYQSGDSVSWMFGWVYGTNGVLQDTAGLITRFEIVPAPSPPPLSLDRSDQAAILRWPTNAMGFVLESTSALAFTNRWAAMTNVPIISGTENVVTNSLSGTNQFYRLRYVLK
jgi:hypothetical protein